RHVRCLCLVGRRHPSPLPFPYTTLFRSISDHIDDIQQNRLPTIEKKSGLSLAEIKEGLEQLRRLNPKPGARFNPEIAQFVVPDLDRKSTRLNSSHVKISYAVFCLKKQSS